MRKGNMFIFMFVLLFVCAAFAQSTDAVVNAVETPPDWLLDLLQKVYDFPVVGPIAIKVAQWFGVIVTIITALTGFLMVSVRALMSVSNLAGLVAFAEKLEMFKNGKIMYWLKYISAFNAPKTPAKPVEPSKAA